MGRGYFLGGEGDSVIDKNRPAQPGEYTGRRHKVVGRVHAGRMTSYSLFCLEAIEGGLNLSS
jgi:hypothetical protein